MKKLFTLLLAMVATGGSLFAQNAGGPDQYGYTWKNNTAAGGPTYNWIDIVGKPGTTQINGLADDNSVGMFPLGFTMKYYWVDVHSIKIGSNGWISFSNLGNIAHGFPSIPLTDGNANFLAPFLSDLTLEAASGFTNPGSVHFYTNNVDTAIVSYVNVPFWQQASPEFTGSNTFQVILTKADNGITFQYNTMNAVIPNTTTFNDAVVGIENITETIGLQVMVDQVPASNTAIKFERPANSPYQVIDAKANWVNNDRNGAFTALKDQPMNLTSNVANVGNVNISTPIASQTLIIKPGNPVFNQTVNLPKLRVGTDTTYTLAAAFTPTVEGSYSIQHRLTLTGDANASNNINLTELVVVDTTGKKREVSLAYNDGTPESLTSFGAAMYYSFPFYPTEVRSIDVLLGAASGVITSDNGFNFRIYAENATGGLGAILFDSTLAPANIIPNTLTTVEIPQKQLYMINSGGVFVSVVPVVPTGATQNTFLLVDTTPPFSFRTFEVHGGAISAFRTAASEDFMINVNIGTSILSPMSVSKDRNSLVASSNIYPNPASASATVAYALKDAASVELTLTNIIGSKVRTLNLGK
ncbi:MAG TPA: hypothetical protein VK927_05215, partial [Adhaeribacter sp.]|nr:hypothetical protein [Adhaeribacter sp.]